MKHLRHLSVAVVAAALIGGWIVLPTFSPSVGTAVAQEQEEEEIQMKRRGMKRSKGQISKPGTEKMSKRKQGLVVEDKQKKSKKKTKSKKKKRKSKPRQ